MFSLMMGKQSAETQLATSQSSKNSLVGIFVLNAKIIITI
jgi:hypothetical protein